MRKPLLVLALCSSFLTPKTGTASQLTVPDDAPTIQDALDSRPDTVMVRPGKYSEAPVISYQVYLSSASEDLNTPSPVIAGLNINPAYGQDAPNFSVNRCDFSGEVAISNDEVPCSINFRRCRFDLGIADHSGYVTTSSVRLQNCTSLKSLSILANGLCGVDSCAVSGGITVGVIDARLVVTNCTISGSGAGVGIAAPTIAKCIVLATTIDNFETGIYSFVDDTTLIAGNTITNCFGDGIATVYGFPQLIHDNVIRHCGNGISTSGDLNIFNNHIEDCSRFGIAAEIDLSADIRSNIVLRCGLDGMSVYGTGFESGVIHNNTVCDNAGSGFSMGGVVFKNLALQNNIASGNGRYGVEWLVPNVTLVGCNDWFGNAMGISSGLPASPNDFAVDPEFCDPPTDFHLQGGSPLVNRTGCGELIGALPVGCDTTTTATLVSRFMADRVVSGIRIVWSTQAASSAIWLERADGTDGPWIRPQTDRTVSNDTVVEIDKCVVVGHTYWYRLVALYGKSKSVLVEPIVVEASPILAFGLTRVTPNPGTGPIRVQFALARAAAVEIELYDVQGRSVAPLVSGLLPAGEHVVEWSGVTDRGMAPSGLYLLRYRYPGGQQVRRLVRYR